jgi:hypothetical protein
MSERPPETPRRRERRQISGLQIIFAAILSIGLLLVINFSGRIARGQQMEIASNQLQATMSVLQTEQRDLIRERDYAANDASVEHWAHTEGKLVREGEILVIPVPGNVVDVTPTPLSPIMITTEDDDEEPPSWHLWWNLFFDGEPPF